MPIYAYRCQACGHEFELMQKMSDPVPSACQACGHAEVRKQLSAAGFQLKGKGWYATDFKGGGKKPEGQDKDKKDKPESLGKGTDSGPKSGGCGGGACGGCAA